MPIVKPDIAGARLFIQSQIWSETGNTESAPEFPESIADKSHLKDFILTKLPDQLGQKSNLKSYSKPAQSEIDKLKAALEKALAKIDDLTEENYTLKPSLEQAKAEIDQLETALKQAQTKIIDELTQKFDLEVLFNPEFPGFLSLQKKG